MIPAWVAGGVRARSLLDRRVGPEEARLLATCGSLSEALARLSGTAYGVRCRPELELAAAQRAIADTALWHLRVLSGWLPPAGLEPLRTLTAWFELSNIDDRLAYLAGAEIPPPFVIGGLGTAWSRCSAALSVSELRAGLAGSVWGDPGSDDPADLHVALRLAWARRTLETTQESADWAAGAAALLIARERFLAGRSSSALAAARPPGVGTTWTAANGLGELRAALPPAAAWALAGATVPSALWRQEAAWWRRVAADADQLARDAQMGRPAVIGCVVLLLIDAWRTSGALESAARGGSPVTVGAFDEVA